MITSERIDNRHHAGLSTATNKIKIQHALNCPTLHTPHYRLGIFGKQGRFDRITITLSTNKPLSIKNLTHFTNKLVL